MAQAGKYMFTMPASAPATPATLYPMNVPIIVTGPGVIRLRANATANCWLVNQANEEQVCGEDQGQTDDQQGHVSPMEGQGHLAAGGNVIRFSGRPRFACRLSGGVGAEVAGCQSPHLPQTAPTARPAGQEREAANEKNHEQAGAAGDEKYFYNPHFEPENHGKAGKSHQPVENRLYA